MNQSPGLFTLFFCLFLIPPGNGEAVETWADGNLPIKQGLELWFDAARELPARQAAGLSPLASGAGLDYWHDASGHARHLNQRLRDARPQIRRLAGSAFLHFDGGNDFLFGNAFPRVTITNATVFVFAAPASNAGGFRGLIAWNRAGANDYQTG